jgi:hypothetical protein
MTVDFWAEKWRTADNREFTPKREEETACVLYCILGKREIHTKFWSEKLKGKRSIRRTAPSLVVNVKMCFGELGCERVIGLNWHKKGPLTVMKHGVL